MVDGKNFLTCLFSYNRPHLLRNAVESIDRFFPWGDCIVIDDGSFDPEVAKFLESVAQRPRWRVKVMEHPKDRWYGGFYKNMNFALKLALEEGYDHCFFFEDDEQLVWMKNDYPEYIDNLFSTCPDAIFIQPLFQRRCVSYGSQGNAFEYVQSVRAYRTSRAFGSTGFWNLDAVRAHPDYEVIYRVGGSGLRVNSNYWLERGYRLYNQFDPTVAVMPWAKSNSRPNTKFGDGIYRSIDGSRDLILKPLSEAEIDFLKFRSPSLLAYQEYFNLSPENCSRPIWHAAGVAMNRYYYLCRKVIEEECDFGQSPILIPVVPSVAESTGQPVAIQKSSGRKTMIYPRGDRFVPKLLKPLRSKIAQWRHFSIGDYLGYRRLKRQLEIERRGLPFFTEGS